MYIHQLLFCILKTLRDVVNRLVFRDRVLLHAGLLRLEGPHFRLVREAVLKLSVGAEESCPARLYLTVLATQSEFHGEPVASGQLFDVLIRSAQGSKSDLLRELSKARVRQERDMAQDFVADITKSITFREFVFL